MRGGIDGAVFASVLAKLRAFGGWSATSVEETLDVSFASETRATFAAGSQAPIFITKDVVEARIDVVVMAGRARAPLAMRISCVTESSAPPPMIGADAPRNFRFKRRYKFARKGEFVFDLTEVRAGGTRDEAAAAQPAFEVEVEWVGQLRAKEIAGPGGAKLLAEKFIAKIQDMSDMVVDAMGVGGR